MTYRAAVIGTGPSPDDPSMDGFAMGYAHADGFRAHDAVELVACADLVRENALAFAEHYDLGADAVYTDAQQLVAETDVDVVSVAVPPAAHAEVVTECCEAGSLAGIHCEKPMDLTWGGAKRMTDAAAAADIQLTFNHQRRFGPQFIGAKSLLDDGEIGPLQRIEIGFGNLYDFGSHTLDLAGKFVDQSPPAWVLGAIDYRDTDVRFGTHNENHASVTWAYENGVHGALSTGVGSGVFDCFMRLVGRDGVLQIHHDREPALRCRVDGEGWRDVDPDAVTTGQSDWDAGPLVTRAIRDVIDALRDDRNSELRASNALQATALIFGAWESVRRDARVDDPLSMDIEDNPLEAMVESGRLTPE